MADLKRLGIERQAHGEWLRLSAYLYSAPSRTRTLNLLIKSQSNISENPEENSTSGDACRTFAENSLRLSARTDVTYPTIDADLTAIIEAWPDLPDAVKADIVTLIQCPTETRSDAGATIEKLKKHGAGLAR